MMRGQVRFGFALAFLLASSIAVAGRINGDGGSGSGGGLSGAIASYQIEFGNQAGTALTSDSGLTYNFTTFVAKALSATSSLVTSTAQLVMSGVTTDITTGTNEDLTLEGNGSGVVSVPDTLSVQVSGVTNPVKIGQNATGGHSTFGTISLNGTMTQAGMAGIEGGGDTNLYINAPTTLYSMINGVAVGNFTSSSHTLTVQEKFSAVTTDIITGTNEDLYIEPNGTGRIWSATSGISVRTSDSVPADFGNAGNSYFKVTTSPSAGLPHTEITGGDFGATNALDHKFLFAPRTKTITSPTDTTTTTDSYFLSISSTGSAAWTPSESGTKNGECVRAFNSGSNVITMTESAGVYEGPASACALGQYDFVEFCYITDRWIQVGCVDN